MFQLYDKVRVIKTGEEGFIVDIDRDIYMLEIPERDKRLAWFEENEIEFISK